MGQTRFSNERWIYVASMGLSIDEQKAVERFKTEVVEPSMSQLVILDFHAEWCGPCKMIAPVLEEIADEYDGKLKVCKLNIDENEQTPPKFNIRGIPTLMLFKNGNVDATKVGALSKSQLAAFLDSNL